jgi:hypothetical protein
MVIYGAPLLLCYLWRSRPLFFGLGLGALLLSADVFGTSSRNVVLHQERTFYGVLKVKWDRQLETHRLIHGNTNHGAQWLQSGKRSEPMAYFHRKGPVGDLFRALQGANQRRHLAVIGLGAGTLASYAEPGQSLTYYEIDPAVVRLALDPRYFTYCEDAKRRGVDLQMVVGDGRSNITVAPDGRYDLLILDAFSSDSLPVHLITREAFELYLRKMTSDGVIAVNVSNRYLDIPPVLGNIAEEVDLVACVGTIMKMKTLCQESMRPIGWSWPGSATRWERFGRMLGGSRFPRILPSAFGRTTSPTCWACLIGEVEQPGHLQSFIKTPQQ